jgi:hypothetical protein
MSYFSRKEMSSYVWTVCSTLGVDKQMHVNHDDCPSGKDDKKRLYIKRTPDSFLFYCHHCSQSGYYRTVDKLIRASELVVESTPEYSTYKDIAEELSHYNAIGDMDKWPIQAKMWWLSYGLDDKDAKRHLVQWREGSDPRLWLNAAGTAWQGRSFDSNPRRKYITIQVTDRLPAMFLSRTSRDCLVIVEDIVSAYKLQKAGYDAMCLMGTNLRHIHQLQTQLYKSVFVWLDNDIAGQTASTVVVNKLKLSGIKVRNINYVQPKEASFKHIERLIHA